VKNRKIGRKPDRRIPVPKSGRLIVLLGLEHLDAGKSIGRLCICTSDQNGESFFVGPKEARTAVCPLCDESHRIVDFKTAVSYDALCLEGGCYGIDPLVLLESLRGDKGPGIVAKRWAIMRALRPERIAAEAQAATS